MGRAILALLLAGLTGLSAADDVAKARHELEARGVPFRAASFMMAAFQGQRDVVELFLAAGMDVDDLGDGRSGNRTALDAAVQRGHRDIIDLLLARGAGKKNLAGKTYTSLSSALTHACKRGDHELVQRLIALGADVNAPIWVPALGWAAQQGDVEIVRRLLDRGARVNARHHDGRTALLLAANQGHTEVIRLLLERGAEPAVVPEDNTIFKGYTALMVTAYHGRLEAARLLIEKGWNVNARNAAGDTPLLIAATQGRTEMVRLLLERGARIDVKNAAGLTPLEAATSSGKTELVSLFRRQGAKSDVNLDLLEAVRGGDTKAVRELLEQGANPNFVAGGDQSFRTAPSLVTAAQSNRREIARLLLDKGAEVNRPDDAGLTPLMAAADAGHHDLVAYLLHRGARIDDVAEAARFEAFHATALYYAAANGHERVFRLLLSRGANINAMAYDDVEGPRGTPIMAAAAGGHVGIVRELIARGAALNEKTYFGATALTFARKGRHTEIARLLEQAGGKEFPDELW